MSLRTDGSDGGPAFPNFKSDDQYGEGGMSLRDWFAGMALQAVVSATMKAASEANESQEEFVRVTSGASFAIADAMLEARKI